MTATNMDVPATDQPTFPWRKATWMLIGGLLIFRILYTAFVPLDLVHDEAYYWDWSRQLDWGYYSKPPMIAWIIALSTSIFGDTELAVRLPAAVLGTCGLIFVFLLAERMFDSRCGFFAVLLSALTPGNAALGLLMTIDAPFLFFWVAALYFFWRALEEDSNTWIWFPLTTLAIGLGLLSKQTTFGFLALGGLFILISRKDRGQLVRPGLWICAISALAFLTPVLIWNAQHDWITAQHTSEHFQAEPFGPVKRISLALEFVGGLFGVVSPVTFFLFASLSFTGLLSIRSLDRRAQYLLCFSAVPLTLIVLLSLKQRIELNWPAPVFPAGIILCVGWALQKAEIPFPLAAGAFHLRRAVVAGAVFTLATYALPFALGMFGLVGSKVDPIVRLRGWEELGQIVGQEIKKAGIDDNALIVTTGGRVSTAELAFYLPNQPRVYSWKSDDQVMSQYDVWGGPEQVAGRTAVLVTPVYQDVPPELAAAFSNVTKISRVTVAINETRKHEFDLYRADNFAYWPGPQSQAMVANGNTTQKTR
ncbi:ArnT family glycosyltransferase [Blastopirellula marina]|uniref:Glycosyltransferase RgtA/B/C/D-like domain-containing protein n=1 Tax=Blastopirellula marina TaxID=124 RepID=A0A2S8GHP4_9BACT|nr:glycosyltransferase family 39 protein [Blastopirellula marina]PQO43534.1 hypothetical protein C5Y93_23065 [Blastopirellula marina]